MKQGTTTTFKVKQFDLPDITEIIFSFTNDKNNVVVERTTPTTDDGQIHKSYPTDVSLEDGYYKIGLDQDETLKLNETFYVEAQIMFSGAVTKAYIDKVKMPHTFYTKVIDGATTNGEEIELAMELSDVIEIEGGGTGNYNDLTNKPRINNIELIGNKTDTDLGLATKTELNAKQNTITGGNGIDVTSDVVSVDNGNFLYFDPLNNRKLDVNPTALGQNQALRTVLTTVGTNQLASKTYVDNLISTSLKRLVVEQLPQNPNTYTIYMVLRQAPTTNNIYDEYMYINNAWELIGSTEVDLSNYYTKSESDNRYNAKLTVGNGIDITNNEISIGISSLSSGILDFESGKLLLNTNLLSSDMGFRASMPYDEIIRQRLADASVQNPLQPKLTAGTNITIDSNNVISASGGGLSYTFTDGLTESSGTVSLDLKSGTELQITNDQLDIDLSGYATTTDLSSKQDTIDSTHKLSADNVDDTSTTNKFTNATEKSTWNDKQEQVVASSGLTLASDNKTLSVTTPLPASAQADSGKILSVNSSGNAEWQTKTYEDKTTISTDTTSTTVSLTLADNHEYRYTQDLTSLTLTMPNGDFISSIVFASGSTPTSMTYDSSIKWSGDDVTNGQFVPTEKTYNIVMWYDGINVNGVVRGV